MLRGVGMKRKLIINLIVIFALLLCGCGSGKNEEKATEINMTISEFVPVTAVEDGRPDIYLIVKVLDSKYWQTIVSGTRDAGEKYGCNVYYAGTNTPEYWQGQEELIDTALDSGADAILLAPNDSTALATKVEEVYNSNIPIVLLDTVVNTESFDLCYMTENSLAGQKAAEEMLSQLKKANHSEGEKLSVGIMVGSDKSQTINERLAGFFQYWTAHAPANWEINTDLMNCNSEKEKGEEKLQNFLAANENIAGLYATNNSPSQAVASVVLKNELKNMVVVGFDYSDEIKELVGNPEYRVSTMLQRQYDMGYRGLQAALDLLNGENLIGKFEDTGVVAVNNENMDEAEIAELIMQN